MFYLQLVGFSYFVGDALVVEVMDSVCEKAVPDFAWDKAIFLISSSPWTHLTCSPSSMAMMYNGLEAFKRLVSAHEADTRV